MLLIKELGEQLSYKHISLCARIKSHILICVESVVFQLEMHSLILFLMSFILHLGMFTLLR